MRENCSGRTTFSRTTSPAHSIFRVEWHGTAVAQVLSRRTWETGATHFDTPPLQNAAQQINRRKIRRLRVRLYQEPVRTRSIVAALIYSSIYRGGRRAGRNSRDKPPGRVTCVRIAVKNESRAAIRAESSPRPCSDQQTPEIRPRRAAFSERTENRRQPGRNDSRISITAGSGHFFRLEPDSRMCVRELPSR